MMLNYFHHAPLSSSPHFPPSLGLFVICLLTLGWHVFWIFPQIEALKAIGVNEVVLAINYQPEVNKPRLSSHYNPTMLV